MKLATSMFTMCGEHERPANSLAKGNSRARCDGYHGDHEGAPGSRRPRRRSDGFQRPELQRGRARRVTCLATSPSPVNASTIVPGSGMGVPVSNRKSSMTKDAN